MSSYQGKHRRGPLGEWVGRVRDELDKLAEPWHRYTGRHRDESDLALGRDILTAVGAL